MFSENKVTKIYYIADDFCNKFAILYLPANRIRQTYS